MLEKQKRAVDLYFPKHYMHIIIIIIIIRTTTTTTDDRGIRQELTSPEQMLINEILTTWGRKLKCFSCDIAA